MGLRYLFICDKCGRRVELDEDLELSLVDDVNRDLFVHDESWESLPTGWVTVRKAKKLGEAFQSVEGDKILCPDCQ